MKSRAGIIVTGRVQGVFYRAAACEKAQGMNLTGWVRNKSDGSVEIMAEGEKENIQSLIEWCRIGPPRASVRDISVKWQEYKNEYDTFHVTY